MAEVVIKDFLAQMAASFQPEKAAGLDTSIQLKMTGDQVGEWYLIIKDNKCTVSPGMFPSPRLTVTANSLDFIKIFTGQLDGMQAFMQGKLRLAGDMNLALKLVNIFKK